jgi:hypothetical protein
VLSGTCTLPDPSTSCAACSRGQVPYSFSTASWRRPPASTRRSALWWLQSLRSRLVRPVSRASGATLIDHSTVVDSCSRRRLHSGRSSAATAQTRRSQVGALWGAAAATGDMTASSGPSSSVPHARTAGLGAQGSLLSVRRAARIWGASRSRHARQTGRAAQSPAGPRWGSRASRIWGEDVAAQEHCWTYHLPTDAWQAMI